MYVTCVEHRDGSQVLAVNQSIEKADRHWSRLIGKATDAAGKRIYVVNAKMFQLDETDPNAAQVSFQAGEGALVKSVIVRSSKFLQHKIRRTGSGVISAAVLEKAEKQIETLTGTYYEITRKDIQLLDEALIRLESEIGDITENLDTLYRLSYLAKGRGGSFGYPLMTAICDRLCDLIHHLKVQGFKTPNTVWLHIAAMKVVIAQQLKDDGGPAGRKLIKGLDLVRKKEKY